MLKNNKIIKITALVTVIAMLISGAAIGIFSAEAEWTPASNTGIYWVNTLDSLASQTDLEAQIKLFSEELAAKVTTECLPIYYGSAAGAGDNDIVLTYDSTQPAQGYKTEVKGSALYISASDADGLFYGCRYVIKQLLANGKVAAKTDSPDVLERALSLDNGRKYYSVEWIKEMIRELSWADMNALVLHFSEEMGWGIESKLYPWLAGRDGTLCTQDELTEDKTDTDILTQDEVKDIVEYAKLYHVEIIPSIDSPGHLNYLVKKFNEKCATEDYSFTYNGKTYTAEAGSEIGNYYHYNGQTSIVKGSRNTAYSRGIDVSNEVAVAFVHSLIEEYGTFFHELGCTKFDIGGDELLGWGSAIVSGVNKWQQLDHWKEYAIKKTGDSNAVAYDAFLLYMNDLNDLVRSLGYTSVRMWNDDALRSSDTGWTGVVQLDTDIDIWFWTTGSNTVWTYADADYQVYNILSDYNYYAMTSDYFSDSRGSFNQAYADQIYNEWTPYIFDPTSTTSNKNMAIGNQNVLGSAFGIWCDNPSLKTEDEVMADVLPMLRSHGAKAWNATHNESMSYADFTTYLTAIGDCANPSVSAPDVVDLTELEAAVGEYDSVVSGGDYTASAIETYKNAVDAGKDTLKDRTADQAKVDAAIEAITEAKNALNGIIESVSFKTARVRSGGTAVMKIVATEAPASFALKDSDGNEVDFSLVTVPGADNVYYLKFTVNGSGQQKYTVTLNGNMSASATVKVWKAAN